MKFFFTAAAAAFFSLYAAAQYRGGYAELYDSETAGSLREHVSYISSAAMEGRRAGSDGETMTAEYVEDIFSSYGVDILSSSGGDTFGIRQDGGDTLTSRNVAGFIGGYDAALKERYIVIGARMDNLGTDTLTVDGEKKARIYYGANGNASGLAMMLELARMLSTNRILLRRSVILVAFGASAESFAGSWYFLNRTFPDADHIDAMINLDMLGMGRNGFYAYTSSNAAMNALIDNLNGDLQPIRPEIVTAEPYPSDHRVFYDKEIPSVMFTTGKYVEHDTDRDVMSLLDFGTMEKELEYIYNYSVALAGGPAPAFSPGSYEAGAGVSSSAPVPYYDCDIRPAFLGSQDPRTFLEKWVYQYLKYPDEAVKNGIDGRVMISFVIDENGKVTDVKVSHGVDPLLDDEAVRVVGASPKWRPGRLRGKKVKTSLTLPVEFRLRERGTKSFGIKKN